MTTFDDDTIQVRRHNGSTVTFNCAAYGIEWPPPERLHLQLPVIGTTDLDPVVCERVSYSIITDEQRAGMTHVYRGAEYKEIR